MWTVKIVATFALLIDRVIYRLLSALAIVCKYYISLKLFSGLSFLYMLEVEQGNSVPFRVKCGSAS